MRALETENSVSRRRVRELEVELERAKGEVETAKSGGQGKLQEIVGEKTGTSAVIIGQEEDLQLTISTRGIGQISSNTTLPHNSRAGTPQITSH